MPIAAPDYLTPHTVQVKTVLGYNALGEVWSDPVELECLVVDDSKLVLDPEGKQILSNSVVYFFEDKGTSPKAGRVSCTVEGHPRQVVQVQKHQHPVFARPVWEMRLV